jgi:hypothetical protein
MLLTTDGARENIRGSARTRLKFEGCHRANCPAFVLLCSAPLLRCGDAVATMSAYRYIILCVSTFRMCGSFVQYVQPLRNGCTFFDICQRPRRPHNQTRTSYFRSPGTYLYETQLFRCVSPWMLRYENSHTVTGTNMWRCIFI